MIDTLMVDWGFVITGLLIGLGFGLAVSIFFGFIIGFLFAIYTTKIASATGEKLFQKMSDWLNPPQTRTHENENNSTEEKKPDGPTVHGPRDDVEIEYDEDSNPKEIEEPI